MYQVENVSKVFGDVRAVDELSLDIAEGEFVALVGPSGSGKSTLLQLLGGMDRPTSGAVYFEGRDLASMPDGELVALRLRTFGFVFQQFNLIPTLSAVQNVEAALAPLGLSKRERHEVALSRLEEVGLAPRASHLPSQLSGGEQQRVAIARALANEPRVILGDEPTGNLDTRTGREIIDLLEYLCDEHHATLVIATHDSSLSRASTRVVRLEDGQIKRTRAKATAPRGS